jgi:hypothetical protein
LLTQSEEIFRQRRHILNKFLQSGQKWLESASEIHTVVQRLLDEKQEFQKQDLELLFHSCRMESAVTIETVVTLQEFWRNTGSDSIKIRLLKIFDRLLDPLVMHQNDPAFVILYSWLRIEEPLVNPYKSTAVLAHISGLLRRSKNLTFEQLNPIVRTHGKSLFENWDEFNEWRWFYHSEHVKEFDGSKLI